MRCFPLTEFELQLSNPPTDGISHLVFSPNPSILVNIWDRFYCQFVPYSSWDKGVYFYDVFQNKLLSTHRHTAAVLTCAFTDDSVMCKYSTGGLSPSMLSLRILSCLGSTSNTEFGISNSMSFSFVQTTCYAGPK